MSEKTMLIFAPHPDDEVLGVGGTIARRARQGKIRLIVLVK